MFVWNMSACVVQSVECWAIVLVVLNVVCFETVIKDTNNIHVCLHVCVYAFAFVWARVYVCISLC